MRKSAVYFLRTFGVFWFITFFILIFIAANDGETLKAVLFGAAALAGSIPFFVSAKTKEEREREHWEQAQIAGQMELLSRGKLPIAEDVPIALQAGETAYLCMPAIRFLADHKLRVRFGQATVAGIPMDALRKSVTIHHDFTDAVLGTLVATNRRLVFLQEKHPFSSGVCQLVSLTEDDRKIRIKTEGGTLVVETKSNRLWLAALSLILEQFKQRN